MANKFMGEVAVKWEDQAYTLRLDFNAMCQFEEETGRDAMEAFAQMEAGEASVRDVRLLAWCMLKYHHDDITLKDAGSIISEDLDVLQRVLEVAMPEAGEVLEGGEDKPAGKPRKAKSKAA